MLPCVRAIARELGVSPSTIWRDIKTLRLLNRLCPTCGNLPIVGPDPKLFEDEEDGDSLSSPGTEPPESVPAPTPNLLGGKPSGNGDDHHD
jgi:hypothetical protein